MWGEFRQTLSGRGESYCDPQTGVTILWEGILFAANANGVGPYLAGLYERHGETFPRHVEGVFALALYDPRTETHMLARDMTGGVPLYYAVSHAGGIAFATRIDELLPHTTGVSLNPRKLLDFLTFFWPLDEETFFEGIRLVPQGGGLVNGQMRRHDVFRHQPVEKSDEEWIAMILSALTEATRRCLGEHVGCHLSGGIDSSVLTVLVAQLQGAPPPAFVATFDEYAAYDEAPYAQAVADAVGSELHRVRTRPEDLVRHIRELVRTIEEPKCHPPVLPRYLLESVAARQGIRIMFSGRGADELFTGYDWHRRIYWEEHMARRTVLDAEQRRRLLRDSFLSTVDYSPEERYAEVFAECAGDSMLERLMMLDFRTLLAAWLVVDYKVSRRFGTTPALPFLDRAVMDLALSMPVNAKCRGDDPKHLFKRAVLGLVPRAVIERKKVGFRTPMGELLRQGQETAVRAFFDHGHGAFWDVFDPAGVSWELDAHFSGALNRGWQIWALACIKTWCELYLDADASSFLAEEEAGGE